MQATIERDTAQHFTPRQVTLDETSERVTTPYRAPLATFLALVASGRARACAMEAENEVGLVGVDR